MKKIHIPSIQHNIPLCVCVCVCCKIFKKQSYKNVGERKKGQKQYHLGRKEVKCIKSNSGENQESTIYTM